MRAVQNGHGRCVWAIQQKQKTKKTKVDHVTMGVSRYGGRRLTLPGLQSLDDLARRPGVARLTLPGRPLPRPPPPGRLPWPPGPPLPPDPARRSGPRQVFRYDCCIGGGGGWRSLWGGFFCVGWGWGCFLGAGVLFVWPVP